MAKIKLSVVMPVYNEKETILEIIKRVRAVKINKEIIIIDDGSTDGTREILASLKNKFLPSLKIIFHSRNKGKGWAIRTGLKYITGEIVIIQDADLEYDPQDYLKLVPPIIEGRTKVVYGSRFKVAEKGRISSLWFFWGGQFLTILTNLLYQTKITDEPTCYKVFEAKLIKSLKLRCEKFEFCPEITAKVAKRGHKILEIPIHYKPRHPNEGKKIKPQDGLVGIWTLLKYRFVD